MPRKKKTSGKTSVPEKPTEASPSENSGQGLWIDPEISRRIKGEGGRRGVEGLPSTTRFLEYADSPPDGNQASEKTKEPKNRG